MPTSRDERGRLLPGSVNNPRGRPPSPFALTEAVRARATNAEVASWFIGIARGEPLYRYVDEAGKTRVCIGDPPEGAKVIDMQWPSVAERIRAAEWVADRVEPRPKQLDVQVSGGTRPDFSRMSTEQLDRYVELTSELVKLAEPAPVLDAESTEAGNK